jgi:hypothetical protein
VSTSNQNEPAAVPEQVEKPALPERKSHYADIAPQRYEITWLSGHVETVIAHQVSWPNSSVRLFSRGDAPQRIQFHAEVDGRWTLQLSALEDDLRTVRNVTDGELIVPEGGAL